MFRRGIFSLILFFLAGVFCFGQAGLLRDYVGLISIHYHPDVVAYMGKFRDSFEKKGYSNAAKAIDNYLKGLSGSGFVYVAPDGTCYILTNEHVVAQSESLSITFEKQDGAKTTYDRLRVLHVDEEKDLALLVFETGARPFTQGLRFSTSAIDEGIDVFAAGFPGLANTAIWQFSRGTISNAAVRLPKEDDSNEIIGPFIQHTAQIDPGNSGGPLLVAAQGVPTGYAVIGINTLSAYRRQAANFAIPVDQVNTFIAAALSKEQINERELIARKVDDFIRGLRVNRAVYGHISRFLSTGCTASNAEYAISELLDRAPRTVLEDIDHTFNHDPVQGMSAAVAWYIESSMRSRTGAINISLDSITSNNKGGFSVVFNVNGSPVKSEWIKEYGVYRLDIYGDIATGDKARLDEKQRRKAQDQALKTEYNLSISAGYAYVFDYGSAFTATLTISYPTFYGIDFIYGQKGYMQAGLNFGYAHPIRMDTFAIMPFGTLGSSYIITDKSKKESEFGDIDFAFAFSLKAGLMFTTSSVPGLFSRTFYNYNIAFRNKYINNTHIVGMTIGYGF